MNIDVKKRGSQPRALWDAVLKLSQLLLWPL